MLNHAYKVLGTVTLLVLVTCSQATVRDGWIDGVKLQKLITDMVDLSMGRSQFQEKVESFKFASVQMDGPALLEKFAYEIESRINNTFVAVKELQTQIEEDYRLGAYTKGFDRNDNRQCCKTEEKLLFDNDYRAEVAYGHTCVRYSSDANSSSAIVPSSDALRDVMSSNKRKEPTIKWQYYGTESGTFVRYPLQRDTAECGSYDPRYRPWYAEAAAIKPKDLVLVFDRSGSIEKQLDLIKQACRIIINSLNADDRIGLVAFNDRALSPPGEPGNTCYAVSLAIATPDNKDILSRWIEEDITAKDRSLYRDALTKAFDLFKSASEVKGDTRERRRVIVFISDGNSDNDEDQILELLSAKNAEFNNSVLITTYDIGNSGAESSLLKNMVSQPMADLTKGNITVGTYTRISSKENLRSTIGSYYNTLNDFENGKPILTTPYVDFSGLGLVISICLPVHPNKTLAGITCIDISLTEIASDVISLHNGHHAYAFIMDNKRRTIIHPLMPDALNYGKVVYLDITDLERDTDVKWIIQEMKSGRAGTKSVTTQFIRARGNTTTDGVDTFDLVANYVWKPIGSLAIAVVTTQEDRFVTEQTAQILASRNFVYHRIDLLDNVEKCEYYGRLATKATAAVKLTGAAFLNPTYYSSTPDNNEDIKRNTIYLNDATRRSQQGIKLLTKQMIAVSEHLNSIWKELTFLDGIAVWRYYGDYFGHIRIFPGLPLPKQYDHTKRGFFWKTVSNKELITITPPYLDAFGAGIVVSVTVPIYLSSLQEERKILGIIGMDLKMSYIEDRIQAMFPACKDNDKNCFIMDTSGYMVYHSSLSYNEENNEKEYDGYHITEVEPDIAKYLISRRHLVSQRCVDFGYKKDLLTWKVTLETPISSFENTPYFDMVKIAGSNIYLGIKKRGLITPCACQDRDSPAYGKKIFECLTPFIDQSCHCPCATFTNYDHCKNMFTLGRDGAPTCFPQPHSIGFLTIENEAAIVKTLPKCFVYDCSMKDAESSCVVLPGCLWCPDTQTCVQNVCPEGTSPQILVIGVGVACGVVLLVILIIVLVCLRRHGRLPCCGGAKRPQSGVYAPDEPDYASLPEGQKNAQQQQQSHSGDSEKVVWTAPKPDVLTIGQGPRADLPLPVPDDARVMHMGRGDDLSNHGNPQAHQQDPPRYN